MFRGESIKVSVLIVSFKLFPINKIENAFKIESLNIKS